MSLSARRAWIEIRRSTVTGTAPSVALRKESVDRNRWRTAPNSSSSSVALRKESVDRNGLGFCHFRDDVASLSARRAWIEIPKIR